MRVKLKSHGMILVPAEKDMLPGFVDSLSEGNLREFREFYKLDPFTALNDSDIEQINAVLLNGEVLALTGLNNMGYMWAVFSEKMFDHKIRFVRASRDLVTYYHQFAPVLSALVWKENVKVIQWFKYLGFSAVEDDFNDSVFFVRRPPEFDVDRRESPRPVMH